MVTNRGAQAQAITLPYAYRSCQ